ncbi:AMP-binding protein [Patulibacter minatonensis]|uniref:AMP-binding protein n=1 Tax=Patulibacter minatonensis TaxID=298163 RepID=UPI000479FDA2|nr:AMP-binding protein [Patulibacter minatonensis]
MSWTETTTRPRPAALEATTLPDAFARTVAERPADVWLRSAGPEGAAITWEDAAGRVARLAGGLETIGVGRGDVVAVALAGSPELHLVDLAVQHLGAAALQLGASPADDAAALVDAAGARVAVTHAGAIAGISGATALTHVVSVDGGEGSTATLDALESGAGDGIDLAAATAALTGDDVAAVLVEDGAPVRRTHGELLAALVRVEDESSPALGGRIVTSLPATTAGVRTVDVDAAIAFGLEVTCAPGPDDLAATVAAVRPTRLLAPAPLLEALRADVESAAAESSDVAAALRAGFDTDDAIQAGCPPQFHPGPGPEFEALLLAARERLGLDALEWLGADASADRELLRVLRAIGVPGVEPWAVAPAA